MRMQPYAQQFDAGTVGTHQRGAGVTGEDGRLRLDDRIRDASAAANKADCSGALPPA